MMQLIIENMFRLKICDYYYNIPKFGEMIKGMPGKFH